jgi:hypothetical protein
MIPGQDKFVFSTCFSRENKFKRADQGSPFGVAACVRQYILMKPLVIQATFKTHYTLPRL